MTQQCCCGIHFWNWGRALKQCAPLIGQLQYFALLVGSSFSCKLRNKWDIVLCIRWAIGSLSLGTKHLMGVLMVVKQSNSDIIVAHKRWYFVHIFLRALSHMLTTMMLVVESRPWFQNPDDHLRLARPLRLCGANYMLSGFWSLCFSDRSVSWKQ